MRPGWWMGGLALIAVAAIAAPDEPLVEAVDLPAKAQSLRERGVPETEVADAVRAAKGKGLSAGDAADMLEAADEASKENGRIDNFGSFVQEKLDEGLRGRELAQAIHEEHEARGIGGGKGGKAGKSKGKGPDGEGPEEGQGPDGEQGPDKGKGPPEGKGPDGGGGKGGEGKAKGGKGKGP